MSEGNELLVLDVVVLYGGGVPAGPVDGPAKLVAPSQMGGVRAAAARRVALHPDGGQWLAR